MGMGRHSVPDPEDSADQPRDFGADQPHARGSDEPAANGPGYDDDSRLEPDYRESPYRETGYGDAESAGGRPEPDYRDDAYWQSQRNAGYDDEFEYLDRGTDSARDDDGHDGGGFGDGGFHDSGFDDDDLDDDESPTRAFASNPPPPRSPLDGPQHGGDWDGEWTGTHRAITTKRRGVSVSVIVALVTVVVVVGAIILWRFFGDALSNRSQVSAARCVEGEVAVAVVVDPSIADQVGSLAEQYNESAAPVGDKCVKVGVRSGESDDVIGGFADTWPAELGERPALWIPGSSVSEARLEAAAGGAITSDSRSLVTSPVLLAVRPPLKAALGQRSWSDLPPLQTNRTALDALNLPGWGALRLALPLSGDADATYVAAEAVAAASAPDGAPATSGMSAINTLVAGQPKLADTKASTAMDALLAGSDPAASSVHAVVTTEQQLYQRAAALPDAKNKLAGWLPSGPAAVADYPTVLLAGDWLAQEQVSAASEFARFLHKPEALAEFAKAGFRTEGGELPDSDVTDFGPLTAPVSAGDNALRATLADAVSAPAQNPAVTIMLEQSMDAEEGGRSRLANVTTALDERLKALSPTADVGLWTFDGVAGRSEVPFGPLGDPVDGQPRSEVLADNLRSQAASGGGAVSFTTLRLIYTDAVANYREGRANSVLVITTGPHTDQSLDGAGLQEFIRQNFQPGKPVAVDVIDFGADSDRATWEAVSQISGGTYQNLNSAAGPELSAALTSVLP
jgi:hypothetical protein